MGGAVNLGHHFQSWINPFSLEADLELLDPAFAHAGGFYANLQDPYVVNTEVTITQGITDARLLRFARVAVTMVWIGSPTARLRFYIAGSCVDEWDQDCIIDSRPSPYVARLWVLIPAFTQYRVTFTNQTDTAADRPGVITLSGYHLAVRRGIA